jgi:hypothetical protein
MGYQTDLLGKFEITPELTTEDFNWLVAFNEERHEPEIVKYSYYCQWVPSLDGKFLQWDQNEKFYSYVEWLEYLIKEFFIPKGYKLNGTVTWSGEETGDLGKIIVKDNVVEVKKGKIVY